MIFWADYLYFDDPIGNWAEFRKQELDVYSKQAAGTVQIFQEERYLDLKTI